jgi:hypothetical protein
MTRKLFSTMTVAVLFLAACSPGIDKKVVVMSSGKIQVDNNTKTVTFQPGTQHNEAEISLGANDKAVTVKTSSGEKQYELPENGLYILNLKSDTLIGNLVNFGSSGVPASISSEQLQHIVDSTRALINGENASDENKTYFVVPNSVKKLTTNLNAQLLNPYKNVPYKVEADKDGKAPEIYKFSTNKQKRESLEELMQRMNIK